MSLNAVGGALLITLLAERGEQLLYTRRDRAPCFGDLPRGGETDANDARILADQAQMRADLQPVRGANQIRTDLRLLIARRTDLVHYWVRAIDWLQRRRWSSSQALDAAFDYSKMAPLILLAGYQAPEAIRRLDATRLAAWLKSAAAAAAHQSLPMHGPPPKPTHRAPDRRDGLAARRPARYYRSRDRSVAEQFCERFDQHPDAAILPAGLASMPYCRRPSSRALAMTGRV